MMRNLTAVDRLAREAGGRGKCRRKNEVVNLASELGRRQTGAAVEQRPVDTAFQLARRFRLDARETLHRRSAEAADAFFDEVREERELAASRLVARAAESDAELHLIGLWQKPRQSVGSRELRIRIVLLRIAVVAGALAVDTGGEEKSLVHREELFLPVDRERLGDALSFVRECLSRRRNVGDPRENAAAGYLDDVRVTANLSETEGRRCREGVANESVRQRSAERSVDDVRVSLEDRTRKRVDLLDVRGRRRNDVRSGRSTNRRRPAA